MKWFATLLLLLNITQAQAKDCYPYQEGELCIPGIGERSSLQYSLGAINFLSPLILQFFNQSANYSGPNCYNTALIMTETMIAKNIRYVSPEEFEILLKQYFDKVFEPQKGDIVVYEANSGRGHTAYLIGENLVLHKKSYHKNYLYRILPLTQVGITEQNEWVPSPWDNFPTGFDPNIGKTQKAYYRKKLTPNHFQFSKTDTLWDRLITYIEEQLIKDGPNWSVGKNMGLITELTLNDLKAIADQNSIHPYLKAKLTSLADQVFQSLEENYYARARGQDDVEEINEEICVHDNIFTFDMLKLIIQTLKLDQTLYFEQTKESLLKMNRKKCDQSLVDLIYSL